ncbi:MAG: WYL domain-containing protein, partial [Clostridiales bacterium]|nr:WYL domain-containing protein [Clostridiales bacterium]
MYSGKQEKVTMVFHNRMLDTVIDKFGRDIWISKVDEWHFKVTVPVSVSPPFFAWVFGLGNYVTITEPENVVNEMKEMLGKISKRYQ